MVFARNLQGLGGKGARLLGLHVLLTEMQALQLRMESTLCGGSVHTWDPRPGEAVAGNLRNLIPLPVTLWDPEACC